ncbi:hypothetical protein Trydic_g12904 [Trypoxylus dichotomus]
MCSKTLEKIDEMDPGPPIVVSPQEILKVIKGIPQWKSSGEDGIPYGAQVANQPDDDLQRHARIILVPKPKKDHHSPEGYRTISLLCTIDKVFETLLLARINGHLGEHRLLDDDQLGFRSGHSTTLQLFWTWTMLQQPLTENRQMVQLPYRRQRFWLLCPAHEVGGPAGLRIGSRTVYDLYQRHS